MIFSVNSLGLIEEKRWNWIKTMTANAKKWNNCLGSIKNGVSMHGTGMIDINKFAYNLQNSNIHISSIDLPEILSWQKCVCLIYKDLLNNRLTLKQLKRRIGYKLLNVSSEIELNKKALEMIKFCDTQHLRVKSDALLNMNEIHIIQKILDEKTRLRLAIEIDENIHKNLNEYTSLLNKINNKYPKRVFVSYDTGHFYNFAKKIGTDSDNIIKELSQSGLRVAVIELNQIGKKENAGWHRLPWEDGKINILEIINLLEKFDLLVDKDELEIVTEVYPWFFQELIEKMHEYALEINKIIE